jgi:hypothetical protein
MLTRNHLILHNQSLMITICWLFRRMKPSRKSLFGVNPTSVFGL